MAFISLFSKTPEEIEKGLKELEQHSPSPLIKAVLAQDEASIITLENLLKEGKTAEEVRQLANTHTGFGDFLLMLAVYKGYHQKVNLLIEYGAYIIPVLDLLKKKGIQLLEKLQPSIKMLDVLINELRNRDIYISEQESFQILISWAKSRALANGFINQYRNLSKIELDRKNKIQEYEQAQDKLAFEKQELLVQLASPNALQEFVYDFFECDPRIDIPRVSFNYLDPQYRSKLMPVFIKMFFPGNPHNNIKTLTVDVGSSEELTEIFREGNLTIRELRFVNSGELGWSSSTLRQAMQRMVKFFELINSPHIKHALKTLIFTGIDIDEGEDFHFMESIFKLNINYIRFNDCTFPRAFVELLKEARCKAIFIEAIHQHSRLFDLCQGLKENRSIQKVGLPIELRSFCDDFTAENSDELFSDFLANIRALFKHNNTIAHLHFLEKSDDQSFEKTHIFPYFEMRLSDLFSEIEPEKREGEKVKIIDEYQKRVKEKSLKILETLKEILQDNTTLASFRCPFDFSFVDPKAIVDAFDSNVSLVECQLVNGNHQAFQSEGLTEILQRNRIFQPILNLFNQLRGKTPIEARFDHPEDFAQVARVRGLDEDGDVEMKVASDLDKDERGKESKEDRESKTSKETKDGKEAKETKEGKDHEESKKVHEKIIPEEVKQKIIDEIIKLAQGLIDPNRFEIFYIIAKRFFLEKFSDSKHAEIFFTLIPRDHAYYSSAQWELAQLAVDLAQKLVHLIEYKNTAKGKIDGREIARIISSMVTPNRVDGSVPMDIDPPQCFDLNTSRDIVGVIEFSAGNGMALDRAQKENKKLQEMLKESQNKLSKIAEFAKQGGASVETQKLLAILNEQQEELPDSASLRAQGEDDIKRAGDTLQTGAAMNGDPGNRPFIPSGAVTGKKRPSEVPGSSSSSEKDVSDSSQKMARTS